MRYARGLPHSIGALLLLVLFNVAYFSWPAFHAWTDGAFTSHIPSATSSSEEMTVLRVVDGDTFELSNHEKVRLIGVDTPETVKPNTLVQCFGKEASDYMKNWLTGKVVRLEKDVSEHDKYGRLLRYVYVGGEFVNENLVSEGYAYAASFPPDISKQDLFRAAQTDARTHERGLWAKSACDGKR